MRRGVCGLLVLAACAASSWAQGNFVYTNNDVIPNTVSGFAVGKDGSLTEVPGSPFLTGGDGAADSDGRFYASSRIRVVGNFLYASNARSNSVSGFAIDPESGALTPVPGSPFPTGGSTGFGMSLAVTSDGQFLYAGHSASANIRVFRVGPKGELTRVGSLVPAGGNGVNGMVVSPDGRWLAAALSFVDPHGAISIFSIDPESGHLTAVKGSPFPLEDLGVLAAAAGVDINCASNTLFVAVSTFGTTIVEVLRIDADAGALTRIKGSPFMPGVGINSNVGVLSRDDRLLFVSNQGDAKGSGNTITVFTVADDGSLTVVPGSPFLVGDPRGGILSGMDTHAEGGFLYVTKVGPDPRSPNQVGALSVGGDGALSEVFGSPFPTGQRGQVFSLAGYPPKTCPTGRK